jgi:hypothetical protein
MNHIFMHNDFFRIYNGSTVAAESFYPSMACDHADRVAAHGGNPRIVLVTETEEKPCNLPIDSNNHVCNAVCRR